MLSLIGSALGFFTSFLPSVLGYFQDKQDKAHELRMMDKQLDMQLQLGAQKIEMTHVDADIREGEALLKHDASLNRKASQWVVNLSASVRPVAAYLFFIEFFALTLSVNMKWMTQEQYMMVWNDPMQAIFASIIGFYFGSRTFNRMRGHT